MEQSAEINELVKALILASPKNAPKDGKNPFFKNDYATLNSVIETTKEELAKNGLVIIQTNAPVPNGVAIVTTLAHTSGQWIRGTLTLPLSKNDPQGIGSAVTYGRRYALMAMVGIAGEDDDGNACSKIEMPKAKSETKVETKAEFISEPQRKRLFAIQKSKNVAEEVLKAYLFTNYGIEHTNQIKKSDYETIVNWVESQEVSF